MGWLDRIASCRYIAAVVIGAMVVAILNGILKKDYVPEKTTEIEEDIELTFEDF